MRNVTFPEGSRASKQIRWEVLLMIAFAFGSALPIAAQQQGPLPPPPPGTIARPSAPSPAPATANSATQQGRSHITTEPPAMPVEQIIQKFAESEEQFRKERDNFTYTQKVLMQELDEDGQPDGEFYLESDIIFTPAGKRIERVTFAPQKTLKRIIMTQQDMDDIEHVQPFVLTTQELPKYDVKYVGREQVDEISAYVLDVTPKRVDKSQRYFQGRIWVEDRDLQIVKTFGQAVGMLADDSENDNLEGPQ